MAVPAVQVAPTLNQYSNIGANTDVQPFEHPNKGYNREKIVYVLLDASTRAMQYIVYKIMKKKVSTTITSLPHNKENRLF